MADFTFTSPEGKSYTVTGPEGATKEQAWQILQTKIGTGSGAAVGPSRSTLGDIAIESGKGLARGMASFVGDIAEAPMGLARHVPQLIADIRGEAPKPPEPTYGERISKATGIEASPQTTVGRYAATTGEVLGSPLTYLGPGSAALKLGAGTVSGLASEAAGQFAESAAPDAPGVATAARIAGGLVGGAGSATIAAERNLAKMAAQLPSREVHKNAATQIYNALKTSNTRISPQGMDDLVQQIKTELNFEGFRAGGNKPGAPIFEAADELATSGGTIQGIDAVRKVLRRYKSDPANALAADMAVDSIDDFLMNVDPRYVVSGNPQQDAQALKFAQGLWATNKQLQTIEEGSIRGQRRAGVSGTGANRINTARQEINKILSSDKKSRGMSPQVKEKMEEIVLGTWLTNKTRGLGKYAPTSPVSASTTIAAGFAGGAPLASAVATGGFLSKYLGEYLTDRQIRELEQLIKSESPMGAPIAQAIAPRIAEQKAVPAAAALRSILAPGAGSGFESSPNP